MYVRGEGEKGRRREGEKERTQEASKGVSQWICSHSIYRKHKLDGLVLEGLSGVLGSGRSNSLSLFPTPSVLTVVRRRCTGVRQQLGRRASCKEYASHPCYLGTFSSPNLSSALPSFSPPLSPCLSRSLLYSFLLSPH